MDDNTMCIAYHDAWLYDNEPEDTCEIDPMELAEERWEFENER